MKKLEEEHVGIWQTLPTLNPANMSIHLPACGQRLYNHREGSKHSCPTFLGMNHDYYKSTWNPFLFARGLSWCLHSSGQWFIRENPQEAFTWRLERQTVRKALWYHSCHGNAVSIVNQSSHPVAIRYTLKAKQPTQDGRVPGYKECGCRLKLLNCGKTLELPTSKLLCTLTVNISTNQANVY